MTIGEGIQAASAVGLFISVLLMWRTAQSTERAAQSAHESARATERSIAVARDAAVAAQSSAESSARAAASAEREVELIEAGTRLSFDVFPHGRAMVRHGVQVVATGDHAYVHSVTIQQATGFEEMDTDPNPALPRLLPVHIPTGQHRTFYTMGGIGDVNDAGERVGLVEIVASSTKHGNQRPLRQTIDFDRRTATAGFPRSFDLTGNPPAVPDPPPADPATTEDDAPDE